MAIKALSSDKIKPPSLRGAEGFNAIPPVFAKECNDCGDPEIIKLDCVS